MKREKNVFKIIFYEQILTKCCFISDEVVDGDQRRKASYASFPNSQKQEKTVANAVTEHRISRKHFCDHIAHNVTLNSPPEVQNRKAHGAVKKRP